MGGIVSSAAAKNKDNGFWLPEDVIRGKILTRLPVKSVIRFRCVCKSWNNFLTQDDEFVKAHLAYQNNNNENDALMFRYVPHTKFPKEFHPLISADFRLGGSVNGLVCVYHHSYLFQITKSIGIWNPATNQYKDIPPPPTAIYIPGFYSIDCGIGFNPRANDYKVIFTINYTNRPLVAQVYSCNADSWGNTAVQSSFVPPRDHNRGPVIVRGRPYWWQFIYDSPNHNTIMCFDVQDEVFILLPSIKCINLRTDLPLVVNLRDSLAVIVDELTDTPSTLVDVYVLDESRGLWTKNYTIGPITIPVSLRLLNCFQNGDLLFGGKKFIKLVGIDPKTHATNRFASGMYAYDNSSYKIRFPDAFGYKETLVSVKGMYFLHVGKVGTNIMIVDRSF